MPVVEENEEPPKIIDRRYRVDEKLGEGGMGVVYRVWDQLAARPLALKCMTIASVKRQAVVRLFEHEFHTLKNLAHPHIVEVHDYGIAEVTYYTMELLDGASAHRLAPMPWQRACTVVRDVASALALIHSRRLVHRDVTVRNIQCLSGGGAKLIDFGSLTPMGVAQDCVGTAAFMAPEALQRLALDQRTDLFSLGACLYYLLTGRHAFRAHRMSELRDAWRMRPQPPSGITPGVPAALDELVLSMLSLNALARPVSAGHVMERLTAIADLTPLASTEVARSFLVTPRLVGREPVLARFQANLMRAMRCEGSCLLVEALPGMGRSRLLDAFALDAQVAGALVVRADARDGATEAEMLAALQAGLAAALADEPGSDTGQEDTALNKLRQVMRARTVVILLDDAHRYGPTSLALLARLVRLTDRQRLLLVVSHCIPLPESARDAMRLVRAHADRNELTALDLSQTTELLASCFDNTPNLKAIVAWCHTVSAGRPGTCVALAQHLVDERVAVYERGIWVLPDSLSGRSLPATAEQLIEERLRHLTDDQRLWGQVLALIPSASSLTTDECVELMLAQMPRARSHAAIEGLIAERLATVEGATTRINQSNVRQALRSTLSDPMARAMHRSLAAFVTKRGDVISLSAAAYHLQQAGDNEEAMHRIANYAKQAIQPMSEAELVRFALPFGAWGETFQAALDYAERRGRPRHELYPLYVAIMSMAALSAPGWRVGNDSSNT